MNEYKPIPVEVARQISHEFDKSMVVILAYDPAHLLMHTVTYGVDPLDKETAALKAAQLIGHLMPIAGSDESLDEIAAVRKELIAATEA